ncbi:MAG: ABC transporter ATP-binding protein [Pseudomonadota bacterium]
MVYGVIELRDLTLGYERHPAVHQISGSFRSGSLTAVVGPNGAGKSTLLKGIVGALNPLNGALNLHGIARRDIAYLPQQAELDRSFPVSVLDVVCLGFWRSVGLFAPIGKQRLEEAARALMAVGLEGFEQRPVGALSGGQLQRVLFARLLLQDARVILLDEPFTAIDARTTADLLGVVQRWHGEQRTVIAVLHDLDLVREHFPEALLLAREPVAWGATSETLRPEHLLRARQMCEAIDPTAGVSLRQSA